MKGQEIITSSGSPINFKNYLIVKGLATNTVESVYGDVMQYINWTAEENIESENCTYNDVIAYVQYLKKRKLKQRTAQVYVGSIKHYYNWLIRLEKIEINPVNNVVIKGVKRKTLYNLLNKKELESLYNDYSIKEDSEACNHNKNKASELANKRNKVMIGLMVWQGLGSKELGGLTVEDVKLRAGKIYIKGSRRSNERELKLEPQQMLDLMEYTLKTREEILNYTNRQTTTLFLGIGQSSAISNTMSKLMEKLKKQNKQVESIKQIRTSVITHWLKQYNLREVQYMAGHRYVSSTEAYKINDIEGLQEEVDKYFPI